MSPNSRNFYDDQFNGRINEIAKPGATPPHPSSGNGSSGGGWGLKGAGGLIGIVIFIAIRVLLFSSRSSSYSPPTYQYTPPPTFTLPRIEDEKDARERRKQLDDLNEQLRKMQEKPRVKLDPDKKDEADKDEVDALLKKILEDQKDFERKQVEEPADKDKP